MKKHLSLVLVLAMVLCAFTGCGAKTENAAPAQETPAASTSSTTTTTPQSSETTIETPKDLVVAIGGVPKIFDPCLYSSTYESYIIYNVFDTLVSYNADFTDIVPSLGELTNISDDGMIYTFKLREDVYFQPGQFQDGRQMTAEDVKFSLERSAKESAMERLSMLDHVEVKGDFEVDCYLKTPDATFFTYLTDAGNSIVCKEELEGQGEAYSQNPIGTGPYKFVNLVTDQEVTLEKNEKYWAQEPGLDTVTFKVITDNNQVANAMLTGEVQLCLNPAGEAVATMSDSGDIEVVETPSLGFTYLSFNCSNGVTADPIVRKALSMAIDCDELIAGMFPNESVSRNYLPVPHGSWGYDASLEDLVPKYDPEGARELLKGTEYENGFEVHFYHSNNEARVRMATIIQAQLLENLNVTMVDHVSDFATFTEATQNGIPELGTVSWSWFPDPYFFLNSFFHSRATGTLGGGSCLQSAEIDALLDKAAANGTTEERKAVYKEAMELIIAEYPGLYFASSNVSWGVNKKVTGVNQRPDGILQLCTPEICVSME